MVLQQLSTLRGLVMSLSRARPRLAAVLSDVISRASSPEVVCDMLSSLVLDGGDARQTSLESCNLNQRFDQLVGAVVDLLPTEGEDQGLLC